MALPENLLKRSAKANKSRLDDVERLFAWNYRTSLLKNESCSHSTLRKFNVLEETNSIFKRVAVDLALRFGAPVVKLRALRPDALVFSYSFADFSLRPIAVFLPVATRFVID
jgi:midasin (ATPase involved in ribosome maturation)